MNERTEDMGRRRFLEASVGGALSLAGARVMAEEAKGTRALASPNCYREPSREVPIVERADVVVAGGGPAGITAAIAAARAGATVRLLERSGCLGGVWTAGLLSWILDAGNKVGIVQEIIARLEERGSGRKFSDDVAYEPEIMKLVLEELCQEAGVRVQLHTLITAAVREGRQLRWAITESKSGRQAWQASAFVDATGDGDLAALAGCEFRYGQEGTGEAQPMSMICMVIGLDPVAVTPFVRGLAEPADEGDPKTNLLNEMKRAGVTPSYTRPTIFHVGKDVFCFMVNHEYGARGFDAAETTAATLRARAENHKLITALRGLGGPWRNMRIVATAEHIGVREGRRIRGLYELTVDDLVRGARFDDAVCRCSFNIDIHATNARGHKGIDSTGLRAKPYDIPYRSLVARDVDGLLVAGRCLSGDFIAHSSYRVTGDAAATGQAAGAAAALAAHTARHPAELPWPEIARLLRPS